jgi:hypothetical protein
LINSGYALSNPTDFAKKFYKLFNGAMGIPKDAPIEEVEISLDEDEEDTSSRRTEEESSSEGSSETNEEPSNDEESDTKSKDDL